jgi:hypothetical protein
MSSLQSIMNQIVYPEIAKTIEEIYSGSLPVNDSSEVRSVDELIGVEKLVRHDRKVDILKRKVRELMVMYEFIKN